MEILFAVAFAAFLFENVPAYVILLWIFAGYVLAVYELRFQQDVTIGWLFGCLLFAPLGPLILIMTVLRNANRVLIPHRKDP